MKGLHAQWPESYPGFNTVLFQEFRGNAGTHTSLDNICANPKTIKKITSFFLLLNSYTKRYTECLNLSGLILSYKKLN